MEFPLFDNLYHEAMAHPDIPLTSFPEICSTISSASKDHAELIYALILHYSIIAKDTSLYGSRIVGEGKGVMFTVDRLPPLLQRIIYLYVKRAA